VYLPPLITVLCGWVVVLVLVLGALLLRPAQRGPANGDSVPAAPAPVVAGIGAAGAAFLWFTLTVSWAMFGAWARAVPAFVPLLLALILAITCGLVARRWTRAVGWSDRHRLAVLSGALVTAMAEGFVSNDLSDPVNLIGKIVLNAVAVGALVLLARKLRRTGTPAAK
jgi:apolipoprotein N-acyltransferase